MNDLMSYFRLAQLDFASPGRRMWILGLLSLCCLLGCGQGVDNATKSATDNQTETFNPGSLLIGTAPQGGAFHIVGSAMVDVLNRHKPDPDWEFAEVQTSGSLENIRLIAEGKLDLALANAATTYFAAQEGYPMQALITLAPNVAFFVTREGSGIRSLADLKGKNVMIGPENAGFHYFLLPILIAHDADFNGVNPFYGTQKDAVAQLADGSIDAAFLGGAIPTESITEACKRIDNIHFVPFDPVASRILREQFQFYDSAVVKAGVYPGRNEDFECLNVGSMHLIASRHLNAGFVYQVIKTLYENRQEIIDKHPSGRYLEPENMAKDTGTPFHPGALKFYQEI